MHRPVVFRALAMVLCLMLPFAAVAQDSIKVVYHVDTDDRRHHAHTLTMLQNHIDATKPSRLELVVVLHGRGVSMLLEPDSLSRVSGFRRANADQRLSAKIDVLRSQGVRFRVCGSTLASHRIDPERDLYHVEPEDVVSNGLVELVQLQQRGYTYLKP